MQVEEIAEGLIQQAYLLKVTDIHIQPRVDVYHVYFRLLGKLTFYRELSLSLGEKLLSHLKFMALMDISEKRKPQSGAFKLPSNESSIYVRISTLPTSLSKESLVIRIFSNKKDLSFQMLSLFPHTGFRLLALLMHAHGLLIFTGPTGSGKSTTMYTLVEQVVKEHRKNVISIEDPVETHHENFIQIQVNEKAGITYTTGLKAILRHDPDIIIVGEIRDKETAKIAIRAALTGHLVLTTLHTRDAKGALYRLLEFGISQFEIEQTLIGVSAQRLVNVFCPHCGEQCSTYCHVIREKQTAVFELIMGKTLKQLFREMRGVPIQTKYQTLFQVLRKGNALGFISQKEFAKWVIPKT